MQKKITESEQFNSFLENELNQNQLEAVKNSSGSFLIIAGAGSGKTRVITARITNLIVNHDVHPSEIIALTFTNKAAKEMKERIKKFLPDQIILPFVGTFHSFCLLHLKKYKSFHNIENFTILDDDDQSKLIKMVLNKFSLNKQYNARQIQYQISTLKNNNLLDGNLDFIQDKTLIEILNEYEKEKKNNKSLDFDDLLIEMVKLFKTNEKFKEYFQSNVKHILVDEYQDTNHVQHELLKQMGLTSRSAQTNREMILDSICVVGDEDQSIYSWRGAIVENINNFKKDFKNTKLIKIEQNYRSVNQILDIANEVIKNNKNRNEKKLWSEKKARNRIIRATSFSGTKEAELVAKYVKFAQKKNKSESVAVLYRTHFQSRLIEEAFLKESINYKIVGGIQFYERKEIKDLLAYLKLIINPFDKVSFFRILNCPTRGLGQKTEALIAQEWNLEPLFNFKDVIKKIENENKLPTKKIEVINKFVSQLNKFNLDDNATYVIKELIDNLDYLFYLKSEFEKKEAESRIENLNELIRAAQYFEDQTKGSVKDFLDEVALIQDQLNQVDEENIQVQMMTLHASKGLEFDHVLIVGLEEGLLPSARSLESNESVEEERRLFYVGITRAKEYLLICNANFRSTYGQTDSQVQSRFVDEIPHHKIHEFNYTNYNEYELEELFCKFLGMQAEKLFKPSVMTFNQDFSKKTDKKAANFKEILKSKIANAKTSEKIVSEWKINHFAKHKLFGTGLIKNVEKKASSTIITVQFKGSGIKKIDSKFLEKV